MPSKQTKRPTNSRVEALNRGVHRLHQDGEKALALHVLGVGKAGANFIAEMLRARGGDSLTDDCSRLTALAVDIGDAELTPIRELAGSLQQSAVPTQIRTIALESPERDDLFATMRRHREFLKVEYPRYYWNPNYEPWLLADTAVPSAGEHFPRAVAKAIYARSYYEEPRPLERELKLFADAVDVCDCESVVVVVFGLGGGTGSGIVVDLARHVSSVLLGRRIPVLGVGFAPCGGDAEDHSGSHLFPVLNELDCMLDHAKNEGVIAVWGDLYRNPFTAGFLVVPQQTAWEATKDLGATHHQVDAELTSFLTRNNGTDLRETINLLHWEGSAQQESSSVQGMFGQAWVNVLASVGGGKSKPPTIGQLGLREGFTSDFIELRSPRLADERSKKAIAETAEHVQRAFSTVGTPQVVEGAAQGGLVQFVVPRAHKTDLDLFFSARETYDEKTWEEKLLYHSWLMDLGVMLSEPAIRFDGMAGECLWGCACWVVVPYEQIRGETVLQTA